jgi:hypothetical protein
MCAHQQLASQGPGSSCQRRQVLGACSPSWHRLWHVAVLMQLLKRGHFTAPMARPRMQAPLHHDSRRIRPAGQHACRHPAALPAWQLAPPHLLASYAARVAWGCAHLHRCMMSVCRWWYVSGSFGGACLLCAVVVLRLRWHHTHRVRIPATHLDGSLLCQQHLCWLELLIAEAQGDAGVLCCG